MSIDIRDWSSLRECVLNGLKSTLYDQKQSMNEVISLKIQKILLAKSFSQPSLTVTGFSNQLPFKFSEAVPPGGGSASTEEGSLPPLLVRLSVEFALPEGFGVEALAFIDVPIPNFIECECLLDVKKMSFKGVIQFGVVGSTLLFGLESIEQFDVEICSSIGMSSMKQIKPSQLDKFMTEKARQAVDLLLVHPLIFPLAGVI